MDTEASERTATVLVIDDVDDLRFMIRLALEDAGFSVVDAATGTEGLDAIDAGAPDLVLLDIRLPDISGWGVLRRVADRGIPLRILIISAHTSPAALDRAIAAGCAGYVVKPFLAGELVAAVRKALQSEPRVISATDDLDEP